MSTPKHIQLLATLSGSVIPALTNSGDFVVTGNVETPDQYEVRAFTGKGLSTYPVATIHVGNPHIHVDYVSKVTNREMEGILSRYPDVMI